MILSTQMESDEDFTETLKDIELRPMNCELNPLTRTDGSALLTQGNTAVIASTYGPIEVKQQNLKIYNATVEVNYRPKSGVPTVKDRQRETLIRNTCETALLTALHPRTAITIQIQEFEDQSGLEACAVNAACLALIISGISMKFLIAGVHCIIDKNSELIIDPNRLQSVNALANFTFVFDSVDKKLVAIITNGKFNMAQYNDALTAAKAASHLVFQFFRNAIDKFAHLVN